MCVGSQGLSCLSLESLQQFLGAEVRDAWRNAAVEDDGVIRDTRPQRLGMFCIKERKGTNST